MPYVPEPFVKLESLEELQEYLYRALAQISAGVTVAESLQLEELHVEPSKRNPGMIVWADGTDWNPGSGAGLYWWNGSAWVFIA
jgi:hypothetical protein